MSTRPQQPELQRATLTLYGELLCRRASWAGELVFAAFDGASRTGLSAASSLVGAASLIADGDRDSVHASNRDGAFDFVVNTLDEALRALKNEIRRRRPLSVALTAEPLLVLEEAAERGLVPRLVLSAERADVPEALLEGHGTAYLTGSGSSAELVEWLRVRDWSPYPIRSVERGQLGQRSLAELVDGDMLRRNWVRNLSNYQRSVRQPAEFWSWLTPDEARSVGAAHNE